MAKAVVITFVTSNRHKLSEIRQIVRPFGIRVRWSQRSLPEPQADDLQAVVRAKLASVGRSAPVLVEDSGSSLRA